MHLGNVYAMLLAWLSARSRGGRVLMRVEDLDPRTKTGPWTDLLLDDLRWLGFDWDGDVVYQHDRLDLYQAAYEHLRDLGLVYPCFCSRAELHAASAPHASDGTPVYAGTCRALSAEEVAARTAVRPPAWRVRVPDTGDPQGEVRFVDRTYGPQHETLAQECGDFVVRRSDGVFAYQLAVVVDDAEMGVTEVVRGRDLLGSVARQRFLRESLHGDGASGICKNFWACRIRRMHMFRCSWRRMAGGFPSATAILIWGRCASGSARPSA